MLSKKIVLLSSFLFLSHYVSAEGSTFRFSEGTPPSAPDFGSDYSYRGSVAESEPEVVKHTSCKTLTGEPDGQYSIYKQGVENDPVTVTCVTPDPAIGMWELFATYTSGIGAIRFDIAADEVFSEVYYEFAAGSNWISGWPDHRSSSQSNGVYVNGSWANLDRRLGTGYAGSHRIHDYGFADSHQIGVAHFGRVMGYNWTNDTGTFKANVYIR